MRGWVLGLCISLSAALVLACTGSAGAAEGPWWHLMTSTEPAPLTPGHRGEILVSATNLGDAPVNGTLSPVTVTDVLPTGMKATVITGIAGQSGEFGEAVCSGSTVVTCTFESTPLLPAYNRVEVAITVEVEAEASGETKVTVTGGETPTASLTQSLKVENQPAEFGIEQYGLSPENEGGSPDIQAGSHPFQLTTALAFDNGLEFKFGVLPVPVAPALPKDVHFALPPGLVGNPTLFPQCSDVDFTVLIRLGNLCPTDTQIGVASVSVLIPPSVVPVTLARPVFNLVPSVGEPARFGFSVAEVPVTINTSVRSGGDYGVTASVENISEVGTFLNALVTFWGTPGDPRHDDSRGTACVTEDKECPTGGEATPPPFLSLPTACTGPLKTSVRADSWTHPEDLLAPVSPSSMQSLSGCGRIPFDPQIKVTPDVQTASTPTGLVVDEHIPQEPTLNPKGLAESDLKSLSVALPEGVTINPANADGLEACSLGQIGLSEPLASTCPDAAKVATVKIKTPLLPDPLEGGAYVAAQNANPFGSFLAIYVFAEDPTSGIVGKAAGELVVNEQTGQLTAHFERDPLFAGESESAQYLPQVPLEDIELHFFGGDRAPLSTPALCGNYTTTGTFTPWSGNQPTRSSSRFEITQGPGKTRCPESLPFAPALTGGVTSIQAGGFTPVTATMSREDGDQNLKAITVHAPPGLLGTLASVKPCEEQQADTGTCGSASLIGHTTVSVGLGGDPYTVTGNIYITGPYGGAPFGVSIVVPTVAGPFALKGNAPGNVEVVRAKLEIDPLTTAITAVSDETGPYKIPTILEGIPLQIKHVNVTIDRPDFTFNPTSCRPMQFTGTLTSAEGAFAALAVPFQVTDCAALAFKPKFTVSTSGHTSRADGASLDVKVAYPGTAQGTEANIAKVKVQLPKRLPSRLKTLQKACPETTFEANPALCPAASTVGHATVRTAVLPVPLTGPAYFVSHGGAKFPELVIVLQGDNVTIQVHLETFISKKGITTATLDSAPDAPFLSFELSMPQGPYSALAANGNLCKGKLVIPNEFTAQDGAKIRQDTTISVTGCHRKHKHHLATPQRAKK